MPGVIGSNILQLAACSTKEDGCNPGDGHLLEQIREVYSNEIKAEHMKPGFVRIKDPVVIPGRSLKQVQAKVPPAKSGKCFTALVERHEATIQNLPQGVTLGRSLVKVDSAGIVPIQIANFGQKDVVLKNIRIGSVSEIDVCTSNVRVERGINEIVVSSEESIVRDNVTGPTKFNFDIGDGRNQEQKQKLECLLKRHESVFSQDDYDVGTVNAGIEHTIPTVDDCPVKVPYRRIPPTQWSEVREYIQKALDREVIRPSSSPYAAPVVLVRKPSGELRMCIDYRQLNAKTKKDSYPLPRIEDALESLKGAKYFSSLD